MPEYTTNLNLTKPVLDDDIQLTIPALADNFEKLDQKAKDINTQLAQKAIDYHQLINYLETGNATEVTLYGDSITAGVGATGYGLSTTNEIMTDSGGTTYYEPLTTSESWANHLRKYLANKFPTVVFKNRGIGGKSARYANAEKAHWVNPTNDVSIVMLGTNDRWDSPTIEGLKADLSSFLGYVKARSNLMIVMVAPPAQEFNSDGSLKSPFLRGMNEINRAITDVCRNNNYIFVSHFDLFFDYMTNTGTSFDYLLETHTEGGSHPKDSGYQLMWRNIQSKFNLKDSYSTWEGLLGGEVYRIRDQALITNSTPITDLIFRKGKTLAIEIFNSNPDLANFPEGEAGAGGDYRVHKGFNNDLYSYRTYRVRQSNNLYTSYWNYSTSQWSAWVRLTNRVPQRESITVSNISVPANSRAVANATATKLTLNNSTLVYAVTPVSAPPAGIVMNWKLDTASNSIQLIFYNLTATAVTVSSFTINVAEVVTDL